VTELTMVVQDAGFLLAVKISGQITLQESFAGIPRSSVANSGRVHDGKLESDEDYLNASCLEDFSLVSKGAMELLTQTYSIKVQNEEEVQISYCYDNWDALIHLTF
jgi:hypothetical protein